MSEEVIPKCSSPTCDSVDFKTELSHHVSDMQGERIEFVFCAKCGTTVGVLPYKDG